MYVQTHENKLPLTEAEAALVWSAIAEGKDVEAGKLIDRYGYAEALAKATGADGTEISPRALMRWQNRLSLAKFESLEAYRQRGYRLLLRGTDHWPRSFADLGDNQPLCLWIRGNPEILVKPMIGIVGSRDTTAEGQRSALDLAYELARDYVIVSGGAYGIDAQAHRGAILAGEPTLIVSAAGVDRVYPKRNQWLFEECLENGGAIVSESVPGAEPQRFRFLLRNRIIAGLVRALIVVEAGVRSGALNTARYALEIGREVGAYPGSVYSPQCVGTNHLIRNGATLVMNSRQVRELAGTIGCNIDNVENLNPDAGFTIPLDEVFDPLANRIYDLLSLVVYERVEDIARRAGVDTVSVRMKLSGLAIAGKAKTKDGKWRKADRDVGKYTDKSR